MRSTTEIVTIPALALLLILPLLASLASSPALATLHPLRLDGTLDRVLVDNAPELNPGGAITIEAWVRPTTSSGCQTIVSKDYRAGYWLGLCSGAIRYYTSGQLSAMDGSGSVAVGDWSHVAVSFDGTTRRYYLNGVLDLEATAPAPFPVNLFALGIGGEERSTFTGLGFTYFEFSGDLAEVRLWDVVRSQTEIRRDMVRQMDAGEEGLIAAWLLEGSADDVSGGFPGTLMAGAGFAPSIAEAAPPRPSGPVRIPRLAATPTLNDDPIGDDDGVCESIYDGAMRLPIWHDDLYPIVPDWGPAWAHVGATSSDLYVCMEHMPAGSGLNTFASVYVDPDVTGGAFAQPDDFRVNKQGDPITFDTEFGTGSGGFTGPGPGGVDARANVSGDFEWSAEFRIPRSLLSSDPVDPFGFQVIHHWHDAVGDDHGWPVAFFWDWPSRWEAVYVDDTFVPPPDFRPPEVTVGHSPGPRPSVSDSVTFTAEATDDNEVASITLFVDFTAVRTCDLPVPVSPASCSHSLSLPAGLHRYSARATDTAGRRRFSEFESLRVIVDGDAPVVELSHAPSAPALGSLTTLSARASDPSGITFIDLTADIAPFNRRCDFPEKPVLAECPLPIVPSPDRRVVRYTARAVDAEGYETQPARRSILYGNTGADLDGDGLSDEIERFLCTSSRRIDSDRDGLKDGWEILGLSFDDGRRVELPEMGANPCRKDVFLQYDYETGARVPRTGVENTINTFRRNGLTLHVDEHERPRPPTNPVSPIGSRQAVYQRDGAGRYYFDPKLYWTHYYGYSRHLVGVSGSQPPFFTIDIYSGDGSCACPLTTPDPSVCGTRGDTATSCSRRSANDLEYRFIHELGHAIGMGHGGRIPFSSAPTTTGEYLYYDGGWDVTNHKPNYISVMNYLTSGGNICLVPGGARPNLVGEFTYSQERLADLDETNLDERTSSLFATTLGLRSCPVASPGAVPVVQYTCSDPDESNTLDLDLSPPARRTLMMSDGRQTQFRWMHGGAWSNSGWAAHADGIDWDCDGAIESAVSGNVNGNNSPGTIPLPPGSEICGNGMDDNGDGVVDELCGWPVSPTTNPLLTHADWWLLPSTPNCRIDYIVDGNLSDGDQSCYVQTAEYRTAIPGALPDCRPSGRPDITCPGSPVIFPGAASGDLDEGRAPAEPFVLPPDLELCNTRDDDGDGAFDEGCRDTDADGVADAIDDCPETPDPDQADRDGDHLGDACEIPQAVANLGLSVDTKGWVTLSWWHPGLDILGFNVYRQVTGEDTPLYLGGDEYPSTSALSLSDPPTGEPGSHTYTVYPVNLDGVEGPGAEVKLVGDADGDGLVDESDNCPLISNGDQDDGDFDGVGNVCDNCTQRSNSSQLDSDGDRIGNACDCDFDQNLTCNIQDFNIFLPDFQSRLDSGVGTDMNGDDSVGIDDFNLFLPGFIAGTPGPSGLVP